MIIKFNYTKSIADFKNKNEFFDAIICNFVSVECNKPKNFEGGAESFAIFAADSFINPDRGIFRTFASSAEYDEFIKYAVGAFINKDHIAHYT